MKIKKIAVFLILFSITFAFSSCSGAGKVQEATPMDDFIARVNAAQKLYDLA